MKNKRLLSIFCRSVGPGGTDVNFYATPEGIKCIWSNENCPYDYDCVIDKETYEASDGHNVSYLSWEDLDLLMSHRPKKSKEPGLHPEPKRVLNKKKR